MISLSSTCADVEKKFLKTGQIMTALTLLLGHLQYKFPLPQKFFTMNLKRIDHTVIPISRKSKKCSNVNAQHMTDHLSNWLVLATETLML